MLLAKLSQALELRQLQLRVKEISKNVQHLQRGKYLESVSRDIQNDAEGAKSYLIEAQKRDANGRVIDPTAQPRIIDESRYVEACDGILTVLPDSSVQYKVCLAAGTLIHTRNGLVRIENIRVGDLVLSQPEFEGELAYRAVLNTMVNFGKSVYAVEYAHGADHNSHFLIASHDHPFWIEGQEWTAAESLRAGQLLQLADGSAAVIRGAAPIFTTQIPDVGVARDSNSGWEVALDLGQDEITVIDPNQFHLPVLERDQEFGSQVFNFEVDGFHTYYVGELGVWVHNSGCVTLVNDVNVAIGDRVNQFEANQAIADACFVVGTLIHTKNGIRPIEEICVGDWVLTYPEDASWTRVLDPDRESIYRQVTQTFVRENKPIIEISYYLLGGDEDMKPLKVTPNHPIMKKGIGWVPAGTLEFGDTLLIGYFGNVLVTGVSDFGETSTVYNFEVDEFHTYFVDELGVWVHNCNKQVGVITKLPFLETV